MNITATVVKSTTVISLLPTENGILQIIPEQDATLR